MEERGSDGWCDVCFRWWMGPSLLVARRHNRNETVPHGCLVATLCTLWPYDLDLWHFDPIFIDGRDIVMDYPYAKFGNCTFSCFGFIALNMFLHFWTLWPWPLTFWPNINWWRDIVMDYPCAKYGHFSFSRFDFIVRTDRQTESQMRMIAILTRLLSASITSVFASYLHRRSEECFHFTFVVGLSVCLSVRLWRNSCRLIVMKFFGEMWYGTGKTVNKVENLRLLLQIFCYTMHITCKKWNILHGLLL